MYACLKYLLFHFPCELSIYVNPASEIKQYQSIGNLEKVMAREVNSLFKERVATVGGNLEVNQ